MLSLNDVLIAYGDNTVLDHISLTIGSNEQIGLVGKNGAGKSTLFRIICGDLAPHQGQLSIPSGISIGYLEQELFEEEEMSILDAALRNSTSSGDLQKQLDEVSVALVETNLDHSSKEYLDLIQQMTDLNEQLTLRESENLEGQAYRILQGLGFQLNELSKPLKEFSGGWRMRVELARLLLENPTYLLLDEPTNHLDIEAIIWLEEYLRTYRGTVMLISHDQRFLDAITSRTIEIERGKMYDYRGSYSNYISQKIQRRKMQQAAYKNQQKEIAQKQRLITRFKAKASKASMAKSLEKQLDKMELLEMDEEDHKALTLRLTNIPRSGEVVCRCENLAKNYGDKKVLRKLDFQVIRSEKIAFVGQNGQGKTTLARIIAGDLASTDGKCELGHNVQLAYFAQNQADHLDPKKSVLETMEDQASEESRPQVRKILGAFLFQGEDVEKKVSVLSGGEKARLAFAALMLRPFNFLVLDEPTNHLDITSKDVLKEALLEYTGTLIVVSHDREFLSGLTDQTIEFANNAIRNYLGDVEYFLEKRQLSDMREAVRYGEVNQDQNVDKKPPLSHDEQKKLRRQVQYLERDIQRLERNKSSIEIEMSDSTFFEKIDSSTKLAEYEKIKIKLKDMEAEWESAIERLE